jgi:hypothetical protein
MAAAIAAYVLSALLIDKIELEASACQFVINTLLGIADQIEVDDDADDDHGCTCSGPTVRSRDRSLAAVAGGRGSAAPSRAGR